MNISVGKSLTACTTQLSNFKLNTRKRGSIHNEHSTDEGHSPETFGHMFKSFGTFRNILNLKCLEKLSY